MLPRRQRVLVLPPHGLYEYNDVSTEAHYANDDSCFCLISLSAFADDSRYNQVRDSIFWPQLYDDAYETLYCGVAQEWVD